VEIINKNGADVNLTGCSVLVYANGSATATGTVPLTGTLVNNDVFVLCTSAITTLCDQNAAALDFSGDDAVELRCSGNTLDVIGRIGTDPGTAWGAGTTSTLNHTLRRLCSVTAGDRDGTNGFNPSQQWAGLAVDTTAGLGSATCSN
jgi:predicted extracellular nuclease